MCQAELSIRPPSPETAEDEAPTVYELQQEARGATTEPGDRGACRNFLITRKTVRQQKHTDADADTNTSGRGDANTITDTDTDADAAADFGALPQLAAVR